MINCLTIQQRLIPKWKVRVDAHRFDYGTMTHRDLLNREKPELVSYTPAYPKWELRISHTTDAGSSRITYKRGESEEESESSGHRVR